MIDCCSIAGREEEDEERVCENLGPTDSQYKQKAELQN